jgi:hypothetical protein
MKPALSPQALTLLLALTLVSCEAPQEQVEQSFIISSTEGQVGVRQLVRTARVLREYRQLTAAEIEQVQQRLTAIFGQLVDVEYQRLQAEAKRLGLPAPKRKDAEAAVRKQLGKVLALPILTTDQRSVVAFGQLTPGATQVTRMAYEVDAPVAQLQTGSQVQALDGAKATLVR